MMRGGLDIYGLEEPELHWVLAMFDGSFARVRGICILLIHLTRAGLPSKNMSINSPQDGLQRACARPANNK